MVSEETSIISTTSSFDDDKCRINDKCWLSDDYTDNSNSLLDESSNTHSDSRLKQQRAILHDNNNEQINNKNNNDNSDYFDVTCFIHSYLGEICDRVVNIAESGQVMTRDRKINVDERALKKLYRKQPVYENAFLNNNNNNITSTPISNTNLNKKNNNRQRSISLIEPNHNYQEQDIHEAFNEYVGSEQPPKMRVKKKLSFKSLLHRKNKSKSECFPGDQEESYDTFDQHNQVSVKTLSKTKKYASALDLSHDKSKLGRSKSLLKKIVHLGEESKNLLKRSMSVRDLGRDKSREKLTEVKEMEWKQSLQSLVENDICVSYKDLSFVDYDALNNINYVDRSSEYGHCDNNNLQHLEFKWQDGCIGRTQSMYDRRSPEFRRQPYSRTTSQTSCESPSENYRLAEQSGALSLPSLHHLQENGENVQQQPSQLQAKESSISSSNSTRYRRRPQSVNSEDGRYHRGNQTDGSFRSAGSGYAKLKRQNACRQKNRDVVVYENKPRNEQTVRSRSLNHLDTLEMRQSVVSTTDPGLKDSRSEPDCTRPLLAPPNAVPDTSPSSTATREVPPSRKHMLSRSQKSSSECFIVNFEVGDESTRGNELLLVAQRGMTLHESLLAFCEPRNIDLSQCDARLVDKDHTSETPLLFTQDTGNLVGKHIRITEKESTSNKKLSGSLYGNHSRKQSGSFRPRTSSFFSSSTEETGTVVASSTLSLHDAADQNRKQIKQRFTNFFGNSKDTKYDALIEQLNKYSKQGIPNNFSYQQQCASMAALDNLEDDWKDIVDYSDLTEKQQQQQTALWELITSEVSYIRTLKVVTDLFLACLRDLQSHNLLKEIDRDKLFSNITEILEANKNFWRTTLYPMIDVMRKNKRPSCIEYMLEGFASIREIFEPYYKYCAEQARCQHYCRENMDSEVFAAYLTWCESQKECNRLRLMDILVQPMQRLTKYGLLLKAILRNTDEDVEKESLATMIKMVDDFVIHVNARLKHKQDTERLKGIIARIESYDIVESKDDDIERLLKKDKHLTNLDLNKSMLNCPGDRKRHLLLEGDLKLKDSNASKMEVHCFLFTDMLLICKPSTKKGGATVRVIRQPYLVDRLHVSELQKETPSLAVIYKNEFNMAVAAFILQNTDAKKLKGWKDGIVKAQALYAQAKQMSQPEIDTTSTSLDPDYSFDVECGEYASLQVAPRSPLATSSRASRVSSLAHSHSGSVEMNDQSSIGSAKDHSPRGISIENENRTGSISSDEGVQPLPPDKSPVSQKNSFKTRFLNKTPNTLSVQPFGTSLVQSLPNLTLGSPNIGSMSLSLNHNTLSVPNNKNSNHLLSPTHRGISYPPPSPTRGNLRRGLAISQSKNPPLIKTRHVTASTSQQVPASFDFDVPVIAGVSQSDDQCESFSRGHHRQAMKRVYRNDKRYHTAGVVDDIKKNDSRDASIHKRLSWNCSSHEQRPQHEDHT